jgi:hypothetical protein
VIEFLFSTVFTIIINRKIKYVSNQNWILKEQHRSFAVHIIIMCSCFIIFFNTYANKFLFYLFYLFIIFCNFI